MTDLLVCLSIYLSVWIAVCLSIYLVIHIFVLNEVSHRCFAKLGTRSNLLRDCRVGLCGLPVLVFIRARVSVFLIISKPPLVNSSIPLVLYN